MPPTHIYISSYLLTFSSHWFLHSFSFSSHLSLLLFVDFGLFTLPATCLVAFLPHHHCLLSTHCYNSTASFSPHLSSHIYFVVHGLLFPPPFLSFLHTAWDAHSACLFSAASHTSLSGHTGTVSHNILLCLSLLSHTTCTHTYHIIYYTWTGHRLDFCFPMLCTPSSFLLSSSSPLTPLFSPPCLLCTHLFTVTHLFTFTHALHTTCTHCGLSTPS